MSRVATSSYWAPPAAERPARSSPAPRAARSCPGVAAPSPWRRGAFAREPPAHGSSPQPSRPRARRDTPWTKPCGSQSRLRPSCGCSAWCRRSRPGRSKREPKPGIGRATSSAPTSGPSSTCSKTLWRRNSRCKGPNPHARRPARVNPAPRARSGVSLVVMASPGARPIANVRPGATALAAIGRSPCPVLLTPTSVRPTAGSMQGPAG